MARVELLDNTGRYRYKNELRACLKRLMLDHDLARREITVVLMSDSAIAAHNAADRQVAGPTDVLSYPTSEPDDVGFPAVPQLGDILISLDTAERQAEDHGHSVRDEVLVLAAHALTHLRGFDHHSDEAWQPFLDAQQRILDIARSRRAAREAAEESDSNGGADGGVSGG